jgi:hypothetical protein
LDDSDRRTSHTRDKQAMQDAARGLVAFCVRRLVVESERSAAETDSMINCHDEVDDDMVRLDPAKVAAIVARRLFQQQTAPWEESLLLARWQAEVPGVGEVYAVDSSMLRGMAVRIAGSTSTHQESDGEQCYYYWKYLPPESLPLDPTAGFAALFAVQDQWLLDDLQPYLDRWSDASGSSPGSLILQYTKTVAEERDGETFKFLTSKE